MVSVFAWLCKGRQDESCAIAHVQASDQVGFVFQTEWLFVDHCIDVEVFNTFLIGVQSRTR